METYESELYINIAYPRNRRTDCFIPCADPKGRYEVLSFYVDYIVPLAK